jgi:hypothetical protein
MGQSSHRRKQANQGASIVYRMPMKGIFLMCAVGLAALAVALTAMS